MARDGRTRKADRECILSIPCGGRATATRYAWRSPSSESPTAWWRSTSCAVRAAPRNFWPRIRAVRCRCWRSRRIATWPNSNAILWYVAGGTPLAPEDRIERAEALQWMFFEQHSLEPNIGAAYFWLALVKGGRELQQHALEDWMEQGYRALRVMENHLKQHRYFAAGRYTVADIALYAYTHLAHECDFALTAFPAIRDWLDRMAAQPGHVRMEQEPADLAAE